MAYDVYFTFLLNTILISLLNSKSFNFICDLLRKSFGKNERRVKKEERLLNYSNQFCHVNFGLIWLVDSFKRILEIISLNRIPKTTFLLLFKSPQRIFFVEGFINKNFLKEIVISSNIIMSIWKTRFRSSLTPGHVDVIQAMKNLVSILKSFLLNLNYSCFTHI